MTGPGHPTDYIAFYRWADAPHGLQQENGNPGRNGDPYSPYADSAYSEQADWNLKRHGDPCSRFWRDFFAFALQGQFGNRRSLLWMVVRCRTSDTFFQPPWKNPQYRGRIWYPGCRDGWLNDETRLMYSAFTKTQDAKERMVIEAETDGPSKLRELAERAFGTDGVWAEPDLKAQLLELSLDRIDWDEICVGLKLLSTGSRPALSAVAM